MQILKNKLYVRVYGYHKMEVAGGLICAKYSTLDKKSKFSKNTADNYGMFHVFYTPDNLVEAVEFLEGVELKLNEKVIFPINTKDIESAIPGIEKEDNSFTYIEKSIGIETESNKAESILVGAKGYYG